MVSYFADLLVMLCHATVFFTPDFLKLHFEQVLLSISSENGAFLCFMHLVVHTYDYIHFVHLSMNLVITTLRHLQEEEINL